MAKNNIKKKKVIAKKGMCCAEIKNLTWGDLKLFKLSTVAFVLFLITVWPTLLDFIFMVHWGVYLIVAILFAWKPMRKLHCK